MQNLKDNTEGRELIFTRLLDAPVELVWKVWTSPEHIKNWWGPDGFTNTIEEMELKPGGPWNLIMHGPDGTDYKIRCIFKEIVKYKRIVYEQFTNFKCIATIEFESQQKKTLLRWQMLFESKEYLIQVAKDFGVDTGLRQNAEKLVNYLKIFNSI
jgi:uncharacterized protein YndB with AHSA1/START domain